jgi:hypothetical protein
VFGGMGWEIRVIFRPRFRHRRKAEADDEHERCCRLENRSEIPLGGEGRQALGWVVKSGTDPPRLPSAATLPERGFFRVTNP